MKDENKNYKVVTLGCRTNQYESQAYIDQLQQLGYREAEEGQEASICVVNTCTVTQSADKRSVTAIRKLMQSHPQAKIMVTGCLAQREGKTLARMGEQIEVVLNEEKETLIQKAFPHYESWPEFSIKNFEAHTRAFVKVQDGCNSYCSYCVIPFVRGRSRSKKVDDIVREIEGLVANGYREVVLTGINIGDFDGGNPDHPVRLHELIRLVDQIEGLDRIRVSSIDPDEVDDALLRAIIEGKKTCHSMHIVLQSGSNAILKRMRRKYAKSDFYHTIDRLKEASERFTFTTDLIVGFPGESDADFNESLEVIESVRFAKVHVFPYSERPKTRASYFLDKVPQDIIDRRRKIAADAADEAAVQLRADYVGKRMQVLVEGPDKTRIGALMGHTDNFLEVSFNRGSARSNDLVDVEITANANDCLIGRLV